MTTTAATTTAATTTRTITTGVITTSAPRAATPGGVHPARHLLRAKDLADARYAEPLTVTDLARAANLSPAHFSREFRRTFGEPPHRYLLTRRLERAAALLRTTDHPVADICLAVGLSSLGSFTTSFRRMFGRTPLAYRAAHPPAASQVLIPLCVARAYGRPRNRTFREDAVTPPSLASGSPDADASRSPETEENPP